MAQTPRLPRMNGVDFYRLHEDDLVSSLAHAIGEHAERAKRWKAAREHVALVAWSRLLADVGNGGFTQFFYNNRGDAGVSAAGELIESIGAPKAATVLSHAVEVYRRHRSAFDVKNPWEGLFGSIDEFEKLDGAFMRCALGAARRLERWVRAHIHEIATDDGGRPIDPKLTGLVESRTADGVLTQSLEVKNGKPHGAYREFFEDGSVRHAAFYKAGELSGDFWPDGQLKRKTTKRGPHEIVEWFHPGGEVQKRFVMDKNGDAVEPVCLYHPNGQLAEEVHVARGKKSGPWRRYFEDGSLRLEAEHDRKGHLIVRNAWDDDRKQVVKEGKGTFREDGRDIVWRYALFMQNSWVSTTELEDGRPHGEKSTYHDGVLWSVTSYENGRIEESSSYWDNGRVRSVTRFSKGKEGKSEEHPKFDDPRPAVVLTIEANKKLYTAWGHARVDVYPCVLNLEDVQRQLVVPDFLREVHERNVAGTTREEYEDWNTFDDGIAYFLVVDGQGTVTSARANGSGVYSGGSWDIYPPLLRTLRFRPGSVRGRTVECRVLARVDHTFIEGKTRAPARRRG